MSDIKTGCTAIVVRGPGTANIGKIVKVGAFLGKVDGFTGIDHWAVNQPMADFSGGYHYFCGGFQLQRLDDRKEKQCTKTNLSHPVSN